MQKAYHDLKEQALRMSIEQDAQKDQIEDEISKLKLSNQDLLKKNKVCICNILTLFDIQKILLFNRFLIYRSR